MRNFYFKHLTKLKLILYNKNISDDICFKDRTTLDKTEYIIIESTIEDGIMMNLVYKDIYKAIKYRIELYSKIIPNISIPMSYDSFNK